nr:hypothetical protein [Tanacetum cinerariifolium]
MKEQRFSPLFTGEVSRTPSEPHHTPSSEKQQSLCHDPSSSLHPNETIPTKTPTEIPTLRQYSRRATRIAQSKSLPTDADDPASLLRNDSQGEAFPTVTSLDADEGNKDKGSAELSGDDAPIKGRSIEIGEEVGVEKSTERGKLSGDDAPIKGRSIEIGEEVGVKKSTERGISTIGVPTGSGLVPPVSAIFTTASVVTPYSRRPREISAKEKGKEKMVESDTPKKKKLQEQIDVQVAREMKEEMAREDQRMDEQIARDAEISRIHAEEEIKMMINGLDRSNEVIAKHLQEYEQSEAELNIREKIEISRSSCKDTQVSGSAKQATL